MKLSSANGCVIVRRTKQRISIARLDSDPEILILDDSLSAVDAETETAIFKNIENRSGKTNIITAHRSAVRNADLILAMENGAL